MTDDNSTTEQLMRKKVVKACWRAATNAKKKMGKCGYFELWRSHGVTCKGIKLIGRAFDCRANGVRFKPGGPLPFRDLRPVKVTSNIFCDRL